MMRPSFAADLQANQKFTALQETILQQNEEFNRDKAVEFVDSKNVVEQLLNRAQMAKLIARKQAVEMRTAAECLLEVATHIKEGMLQTCS